LLGLAAAHVAQGLRGRAGPTAALRALRGMEGIDFRDPHHADALRALVRYSHEAGQPDAARAELRAAQAAHPKAAAFHEIEGLRLQLEGAPAEQVRAAYERALAIEPENARARAGRGRLALASDPEGALADLDRAAQSEPIDASERAEVIRQAAEALMALGRVAEAEQRLRALLLEYPYDAKAAAALVEIELGRGRPNDRTLELTRRAVRFGGGADALELLARVHRERGEPEQASEAAERAQQLREGRAEMPEGGTPPGETG
jgi:tetratricopeptide (TPR) repeat protein